MFVFLSLQAGAADVPERPIETDEKQGRAMCEIFLSPGYLDLMPVRVPLGSGHLPRPLDRFTFFTRAEAEDYLSKHVSAAYAEDLRSALSLLADGRHLIYLSSIGPTLWQVGEFAHWSKMANGPLTNDSDEARDALVRLARSEPVEYVSPQAQERVRNSLLARGEQLRVEREIRMQELRFVSDDYLAVGRALFGNDYRPEESQRQEFFDRMLGLDRPVSLPPDPATGKPEDLSRVKPELRQQVIALNFGVHAAKSGTLAAREIRDLAPSLFLPWETDYKVARRARGRTSGPEDFQTIRREEDAIWIMRTLIREDLVSRRVVDGRILADLVGGDDLFMLAAHPELMPIWRQAVRWKVPIRHELMHAFDGFYTPQLIDRRLDKPLLLQLEIRREMKGRAQHEQISSAIAITNTDSWLFDSQFIHEGEAEGFREWLRREWSEFARVHGVTELGAPRIEPVKSAHEARTPWFTQKHAHILIQFYGYLFEKYPALEKYNSGLKPPY